MPMVYLDDKFVRHPKVMAAMSIEPLAPWLFVCAISYCREHLTGGLIARLVVPTLMPGYKPKIAQALVTVNLLEESGKDWLQVHDYESWNFSEDQQRVNRSAKARKAANSRWEQERARVASADAGMLRAVPEH